MNRCSGKFDVFAGRSAVALLLALALPPSALANGRAPGTSTINFRQGTTQDIVAGLTFGLVISHDGGRTWGWMCEKAVLYGGMYDPDYAYTASGALFATTFDGSLVNRDGCTFGPTQLGKKFISSITNGPDGALYLTAADAPNGMGGLGDAKIYKSTDNGATFPIAATAGQIGDWYSSIEVAPSDPNRVYLSGFRLDASDRTIQVYRSNDGGLTFAPVTSNTFTISRNSTVDIVGIKANAPDTVFARVTLQGTSIGDAIWRSDDGGINWVKIFETSDYIAFAARANGDLVAATRNSGTFVSRGPTNASWEPVSGAPHINCLAETSAGELWACTQNFGAMQTPTDDAAIMKSTDLTTWTKVLQYQDIVGPVDCAAGTRQHDQCVFDCADAIFDASPAQCSNTSPTSWCALKNQLGITSTVFDCPAVFDASPDALTVNPKDPKGCCNAGETSGGPAALLFGLSVSVAMLRLGRRRDTHSSTSRNPRAAR